MKMKKVILVLMALLTGSASLFAQEKLVLSLDSAKHYALEYNKTLIKSGLSIQAAQAQLWQAIAQGLPQVSGTVDYTNYFNYTMDFGSSAGGGLGMQLPEIPELSTESVGKIFGVFGDLFSNIGSSKMKDVSTAKLQVSQLIFSGNYWVGIELSKMAKQIAETQKMRSELEVKQTVSTAFYNVLMAEEVKGIVMKNLDNLRDIYRKTEATFKAGVAEETDVDQLMVQVMTMETTLKSTERNIELAYNMLRLQLGTGSNVEIEIVGNLNDAVKDVNIGNMLEKDLNMDANIDYKLMKQQVDIMGKQVNLQKWSYAPTIAGFYNYTYKIRTSGLDMTPPHVIGLTANIPIFSSGDRYKKVAEAKINLKSAEVEAENIADQLTIQEKQLRFNLQNAYDQYLTQQKNVSTSRKVFNSMQVKYDQGVISSLDLTTANTNYLQAENSYISAKLNLMQAQVELEKLLGIL